MDRVHLFSNGDEWRRWQSVNCERCVKNYDYATQQYHCDLYEAIDDAGASDGTISPGIAERLQVKSPSEEFPWRCGELVTVANGPEPKAAAVSGSVKGN